MRILPCLFLAAATFANVRSAETTAPAAAAPATMNLPAPAGADSGESSLVRGPDGTVYLTWAAPGPKAGERALYLATLAADALAWSPPRVIVSTPLLMENWADFATLAVGTDGALTAQWFQRQPGEDSHGYDGWFARSTDGGATWNAPAPLGHEFVSLVPVSGGRTLAVWLESARVRDPHAPRVKRDPNAPRPAKDPAAPYAPSMRLSSCLLGPDGTTLKRWVVDPDVCTCCQTSLARLPDDRAIVTYRGHLPDETRNNLVAAFGGESWDAPRPLHDDGWKIAGCPVNGPAADTLGERTAMAWYTVAGGVARVQVKLSTDGGKNFGPPLPLDLGRPLGRLDLVMLADGSSVVSWIEAQTDENAAGLYVRRIFPDGKLSVPQLVAGTSSARASGFARMATRPGDELPVVLSWTETGPAPALGAAPATQVRTLQFSATALARETLTVAPPLIPPAVAVVRANTITFLELCAPAAATGDHP